MRPREQMAQGADGIMIGSFGAVDGMYSFIDWCSVCTAACIWLPEMK